MEKSKKEYGPQRLEEQYNAMDWINNVQYLKEEIDENSKSPKKIRVYDGINTFGVYQVLQKGDTLFIYTSICQKRGMHDEQGS